MATAMNCTVKVYKGVPLVKGGTEVLYLSQGSAEGAIAGKVIKTYTQYYYTREDENKIQVEDDIAVLEGANYVSFANISHGGKIYFGFIDHLRYVSDKCTEIQFTIDPFPTFLADTTMTPYIYVKRNSPIDDTRGVWLEDDYIVKRSGDRWGIATPATLTISCTSPVLYHVCKAEFGNEIAMHTTVAHSLPVQILQNPTQADITGIIGDGGNILGCYLMPSSTYTGFVNEAIFAGSNLTLNVPTTGYRHSKLTTGVYNKVSLTTTQGVKYYELEDFTNTTTVSFGVLYCALPSPNVLIYPKAYKGVADNLAEGLTMQFPAIPISTPQVYSQGQAIGDMFNVASSALTGVAMGAMRGGGYGAVAGALIGTVTGIAGMQVQKEIAKYQPTGVTQTNFPLMNSDYTLKARLDLTSPDLKSMQKIDAYMDYYGYNIEEFMDKNDVNFQNDAYLQVGVPFLHGSEGDNELNARCMAGIKIKTSFT